MKVKIALYIDMVLFLVANCWLIPKMYILCCLEVNFKCYRLKLIKIWRNFKISYIFTLFDLQCLKLTFKQQNMYIFRISEQFAARKSSISIYSANSNFDLHMRIFNLQGPGAHMLSASKEWPDIIPVIESWCNGQDVCLDISFGTLSSSIVINVSVINVETFLVKHLKQYGKFANWNRFKFINWMIILTFFISIEITFQVSWGPSGFSDPFSIRLQSFSLSHLS
jgi:hypothetical protein